MDYSKFSDRELVEAFILGQEPVLNVIIQRHQSRIFGYIMMSVKDRDVAQDIFQDTFMKVINKIKAGKYSEEGKFIQWTMRIAHNLIIDYFRKNSRVKMLRSTDDYDVFNQFPLFDKSIEEEMIINQTHSKLRDMIEYLPDNQKEVLVMRHYQEMSFKDISEETGVSINTALGRMRYALINLRKMMDEQNISLSI
ncbi:MAG: RNA polymerase subunit sigma-24 [Bacteroidetes bacterium CG2_30_33_31]|nr:MAG: RNA polymerase subunit sigma-24 [Bacteroidetes bacterium CG2_30_33_31]